MCKEHCMTSKADFSFASQTRSENRLNCSTYRSYQNKPQIIASMDVSLPALCWQKIKMVCSHFSRPIYVFQDRRTDHYTVISVMSDKCVRNIFQICIMLGENVATIHCLNVSTFMYLCLFKESRIVFRLYFEPTVCLPYISMFFFVTKVIF